MMSRKKKDDIVLKAFKSKYERTKHPGHTILF